MSKDSASRYRLRELGHKVGILETGKKNSITDVPGVLVGHSTIIDGEGKLAPGAGPKRTGVTVIIPHMNNVYREKVRASSFVLNGFGKTIGLAQIEELGYIESYIALTNALNVPIVADALIEHHIGENQDIGITTSSIGVVVGECNDGYLNDIQGRHVRKKHVNDAIAFAADDCEEGCVGAGTGMVAFGYKGGIGTSSRIIKTEKEVFTLGVLVLSNFGKKSDLTILGRKMHENSETEEREEQGSIMVIIATDAPLTSRQLNRLTKRAALGISRTGGYASYGSGDFIIGFSTKNTVNHDDKTAVKKLKIINEKTEHFNNLLRSVVEATEESILNSLLMATTTKGRDNHLVEAISIEKVKELLSKWSFINYS